MQIPFQEHPDSALAAGSRWARLARLASVCGRQMRRSLGEQAARHDLNDAEFLLLWACRESAENDLAQNGLAASIGLSSSQLSGLVERLRQRGLADVKRSRLDRRRQHWCLTADGKRVVDDILVSLAPLEESLDAELAAPTKSDALQLLHQLAGAVERATQHEELGQQPSRDCRREALQGAAS